MIYDNIYDYIENEKIIKICGDVGSGKTIATSLINYYLSEPTIVFGENIKQLHKHFKLLDIKPTNDIKFFGKYKMENMNVLSKKLKRFQSLSSLGIDGREIDYTTLILETETPQPFENGIPGSSLLMTFDRIIMTYQTQRHRVGERLIPRDMIVPDFRKNILHYNGKEYKITDIISRKLSNDRNRKIDDILNTI